MLMFETLDRRQLTQSKMANPAAENGDDSPKRESRQKTAAMRDLSAVWQSVLKVRHVDPDDRFFDLGGDSLLSIEVMLQAKHHGWDVSLQQILQHQTLRELAQHARRLDDANEQVTLPTKPTTRDVHLTGHGDEYQGERFVRVSVDRLRRFGRESLEKAGLAASGAAIVTEVQLESSLRGQPTHNIADIPRYARRLQQGILNPRPNIRLEREISNTALIDGDNGPGQWVSSFAIQFAIKKAQESGVAIVGARRSNHFGAAGQYIWKAACSDLIGICTTNGPLILAPTGGVTPTFGNNPVAAAVPSAHRHPVLLDIAMSVAPRGKIGLELAEGRPLQPGWILDGSGNISTDLSDLAAGLGAPIGNHKGYGLALIMEILAGVLTGAGFCWDHHRHGQHDGNELDLGHLFIVIDPELFMPLPSFTERIRRLIDQTKSGDRRPDCDEILIPGEVEFRARETNLRDGVPIRSSSWSMLCDFARKMNLKTELRPL